MVAHYTSVTLWRDLRPEAVAYRATRSDKALILDYTPVTKDFQGDIGRAILSPL